MDPVIKEISAIITLIIVPLAPIILSFLGYKKYKNKKKHGSIGDQIKYQLNNGDISKIHPKVINLKYDIQLIEKDIKNINKEITFIKDYIINKKG